MLPLRRHPRVLVLIFAFALTLIAPLGAAATALPDDDPGSPVRLSNAAMATTLFESVFNDHDGAAAARLVSADAQIVTPARVYTGPQGLMGYLATIRRAYPDASFDLTSYRVLEDGSVVLQWTMTATRFMVDPQEPPINVRASMPGETTIIVADGQIAAVTETRGGVAFQPQAKVALIGGQVVWL